MQKDETWVKKLQLLNEIIQKTPLKHSIKLGIDVYTFAGHNVIGICGFKNY